MTAVNQNFTMYSGDTKILIIPITKADNTAADLTNASIKWGLYDEDGTERVSKVTGAMTITGNEIRITLDPVDTQSLSGAYFHECELTDQYDNVSTLFTGMATIIKGLV